MIGNRYREQVLTESRFWIPELELGIGLWEGCYQGCSRWWLRWYNASGDWVLTPEEFERQRAELESQRAELESQRAELESQRANRLADRLRAMGINPEEL
ncbi:hypothetical protein [Microcoleus sp. S13_B4]|uniref:hypothetical protein n=1 Tax=Microcoleus sp. S13_B4 TaxID=3055408 RepID=UPI002FD0833C